MTQHGSRQSATLANAVAIAAAAATILVLVLAIRVGSRAAISPASTQQTASAPAPVAPHAAATTPPTVAAAPSRGAASASPTSVSPTTPTTPATPTPVAGPFEGDLTIPLGTTVTFTNNLGDGEPHSVTARDGSWDTGLIMDGQSVSITFNTPGKYPYYCVIHENMIGTITVLK